MSYGIVWREGEEPSAAGKLELLPGGLRLEGRDGKRDVRYDELTSVRIARSASERLGGRPSLVVDRRHGDRLTIAAVSQSTVVGEIAEQLAERSFAWDRDERRDMSFLPTPGPGDSEGGDIF